MLRGKRNLRSLSFKSSLPDEVVYALQNYTSLAFLEILPDGDNEQIENGWKWAIMVEGCVNLLKLDLTCKTLMNSSCITLLRALPPNLMSLNLEVEKVYFLNHYEIISRAIFSHTSLTTLSLGVEIEKIKKACSYFSVKRRGARAKPYGFDAVRKVESVLKRNRKIWRERFFWCFWLNAIARNLLLGKCPIPREILKRIIYLVPFPAGYFNREKVVRYAERRATLKKKAGKEKFVNFVFGWEQKFALPKPILQNR